MDEEKVDKEASISKIALIVRSYGGPLGREEAIARQLWKRSEQMAVKHGIKQVEALDYFLRAMISGAQGELPPKAPWEKG